MFFFFPALHIQTLGSEPYDETSEVSALYYNPSDVIHQVVTWDKKFKD